MKPMIENFGGTLFAQRNSLRNPKIIAHRGAAATAPENSLPAFEHAGRLGVWAIETDIHKTRDHVLVCCHNPTIDATFDGEGAIADMTYSDLLRFRITKSGNIEEFTSSQLQIPTFEQYLRICRTWGSVPFVEFKTGIVEEAAAMIRRMGMEDYCVLSSIQFELLEAARDCSKRMFIHHIFSSENRIAALGDMGYAGMSFNCPNLDEVPDGLVERVHECGLRICFRAADTQDKMIQAIKMGADYVPSNRVYVLKGFEAGKLPAGA